MKPITSNHLFRIIVLLALLTSFIPASRTVKALPLLAPPPVDMFQLPWEQGLAWVAFDGLDNGRKRSPNSPHNYNVGGAVDFAPHANMVVGENTSNFWVTAAAAGQVVRVTSCYIIIDHGNGWTTEYWHLANIQIQNMQMVSRNQRLGVIADNISQPVCVGNDHPGPHLHFVMRPKIIETVFAGWTINYSTLTNLTTFKKNGQSVGRNLPILNIPNLQTVLREPIVWDTQYRGSVDPYRRERWPLQLTEQTQFDITVAPTNTGLIPVIILLNASGVEITRANGTLTSTQPAGSYFVQIESQAGTGFYNLIAQRSGASAVTATPTATGTLVPTSTPTLTNTPIFTDTPTATSTVTETPVFTPTASPTSPSISTDTPTPTGTLVFTNTPVITDTFTPTATETLVFTNTPSNTPVPTDTATPVTTDTPVPTISTFTATSTSVFTSTPTATATIITGPYVLTSANPLNLNIGQFGLVTVSLNNIPVDGYTSTEFTCTYNSTLIDVSNIAVAGLFGADPVSGILGPQNGSFIIAIAGSNGNRAMGSGTAFTFNVQGLQAGQTAVECTARVSNGQSTLQSILSIPTSITIAGAATATAIPTSATLTGQVLASKIVTIRLYNPDNSIAATTTSNPDGTFSMTVPGGMYTVVATAEGFLSAQGPVTLFNGNTSSMPIVSLIAGDIDNNGVIDEFDALTIGINYNNTIPTAADLNNDGVINVLDLGILAQNYGASGALAW